MYGGSLLGLALLAVWIWAIYDVLTTPDGTTRALPKMVWVLIVVLFVALGAFAWIALGRPYATPEARPQPPGTARPPRPPRSRRHPSDARDEAHRLSERERLELERREYYKRMDEELDRRLEEKRRRGETADD